MKKVLSIILKYGVPVIIGVGLIYFLYKNVDLEAMKATLASDVNYWWFVPVICVSIMSHVFRALRWRLQLRAIDVKTPLHPIVNSIFGTYAVNLVFPRLGEVWRCGYIANREKASFTQVVGSMVADRLSDTVTVLALTLFTFFLAQDAFYSFLDTYPQVKDGLVGMITSWKTWVAAVVGVTALVWLFTSKTENKLVLKVKDMVKNLWDGFAAIWHMEGKWWFLLYTVCIWGCYFFQLYIAAQAFSYTCDLSALAILVLFVLSSIGMGIPTNGGLGAWHMAIIFGLSLYGVGTFSASNPDTQASAFAMLVWGIQTLLLIVLGIYAFTCIALEKKK
ncbi:MAG: flippase-like domain-containing protein [Bacteroidales bacterium]|nr:flippase-like domain-containing protein [Candidatus Sodaliphilus fimicaballi]